MTFYSNTKLKVPSIKRGYRGVLLKKDSFWLGSKTPPTPLIRGEVNEKNCLITILLKNPISLCIARISCSG